MKTFPVAETTVPIQSMCPYLQRVKWQIEDNSWNDLEPLFSQSETEEEQTLTDHVRDWFRKGMKTLGESEFEQ